MPPRETTTTAGAEPAAEARPAHAGVWTKAGVLGEARSILRLAYPVVVAQVGLLMMGLVDTWMVGRLGPVELAAVALGNAVFFTVACLALGIVQALDPLIAQAHGARDAERCAAAWRAGIRLALLLTLPLTGVVLAAGQALGLAGLDPQVVQPTMDYIVPRTLGVLPWLLWATDRCLLNGLGVTLPTAVVTLLANVVNAALAWVFIFGAPGVPALGVAGAALATALCSWFMYLALAWWMRRHPRYGPYRLPGPLPGGLLAATLRLGLPIGLAHAAEVGAFAAGSVIMGRLGVVALASHQIAIQMASLSFMVALAIGVAASIRVGQAIGARRNDLAGRAGWTGLGLGMAAMGCWALVFLGFGRAIADAFTDDPEVVALGASLLAVAAAFQLSDGAQTIAAGAIRGCGDTRWPLWANLVAHWGVALPLAWVLVFRLGYGPEAVWWSLALGLTGTAGILVLRFQRAKDARPISAHSGGGPPGEAGNAGVVA